MKRTVLGKMLRISRRQSSRDKSGRELKTVKIMSHRDSKKIYRVTNHGIFFSLFKRSRKCILERDEAPEHFFPHTAITSPHCQEFMV